MKKNTKLAANSYVKFRGGPAPKNVKATTMYPSHNPSLKTPAQKKGYEEDKGLC